MAAASDCWIALDGVIQPAIPSGCHPGDTLAWSGTQWTCTASSSSITVPAGGNSCCGKSHQSPFPGLSPWAHTAPDALAELLTVLGGSGGLPQQAGSELHSWSDGTRMIVTRGATNSDIIIDLVQGGLRLLWDYKNGRGSVIDDCAITLWHGADQSAPPSQTFRADCKGEVTAASTIHGVAKPFDTAKHYSPGDLVTDGANNLYLALTTVNPNSGAPTNGAVWKQINGGGTANIVPGTAPNQVLTWINGAWTPSAPPPPLSGWAGSIDVGAGNNVHTVSHGLHSTDVLVQAWNRANEQIAVTATIVDADTVRIDTLRASRDTYRIVIIPARPGSPAAVAPGVPGPTPPTVHRSSQHLTMRVPTTITHNLGQRWVSVTVYDSATGQTVNASVTALSASAVQVTSSRDTDAEIVIIS
jgi:hypothetical protein